MLYTTHQKLVVQLALLVSSMLIMVSAFAEHPFEKAYLKNFQEGSMALKVKTAKKIYNYSGITNEEIFDLMEQEALTLARKDKPSGEETEAASWFTKTLAASGNDRYRESLQLLAKNAQKNKVKKYAKNALNELDKFKRWNAVINDSTYEMEGINHNLAKRMRFIASDQADMGNYAIEQARKFADYDLNFLILIEEKLHEAIPKKDIDKDKVKYYRNVMDYLMAHPDFGKYTSLVNQVAEQAKNKQLQKAARKALNT